MNPCTSPPNFPLVDLCTRALSSPSSITPSERNLILGRPDPATENSLYIAKTSLPRSALVAKAVATPPTLSPKEAQVLLHGPIEHTHGERAALFQAYDALTTEHRELLDRASHAVTDEDEKKAMNVAYDVLQSAKAEEEARQESTSAARQAERRAQPRPPYPKPIVFPWERADWITLIREKNYPSWGIAVLRTAYDDPAAWLTFQTRFSALAAPALAGVGPPDIANNFRTHYISDEDALAGAEQAGLLAYYARLVRERKLEDGYRWGVFVSADEKVLEDFSKEKREWLAPVWEAGWRAREVGTHGWNGLLAMRADLVFGILMPMLARGDKTPLQDLALMAVDR